MLIFTTRWHYIPHVYQLNHPDTIKKLKFHLTTSHLQAEPQLGLHRLGPGLGGKVAPALRQLPAARQHSAEHPAPPPLRTAQSSGQQFVHVPQVRSAARPAALDVARRSERCWLQRVRFQRGGTHEGGRWWQTVGVCLRTGYEVRQERSGFQECHGGTGKLRRDQIGRLKDEKMRDDLSYREEV